MAYIGLPPKANFTSGLLDRFTSTTGTTVTLTHDISSENDIVVFVNFVKQDSTTYSVGGTGNKTLTLGGTWFSSDIVEVHYLNIVGQTVNPSANSVGSSQLTADSITGQTAETSIADDDTIIIHDTSASALRKMTKANFTSGIGGTNSKMFLAKMNASQTMSSATATKMTMSEVLDPDSVYDGSSNYRWTPGETGKYYIFFHTYYSEQGGGSVLRDNYVWLRKNGSNFITSEQYFNSSRPAWNMHEGGIILDVTSTSDYFEIWAYISVDSGTPQVVGASSVFHSYWGGYKLLT